MDGHGEDIDFGPSRSHLESRLLSSGSKSVSASSTQPAATQPAADMRTPRPRPPSPNHSACSSVSAARYRDSPAHSPRSLSISLPARSQSPSQMPPSKRDKPHPVLRWLTGKQRPPSSSKSPAPSPTHTSNPSPSLTPTSSTPTTPSSAASALADAMHDDPLLSSVRSHFDSSHLDPDAAARVALPMRPEAARLPAHFRASRPPNYLSQLTRSTLPTACLSPPTSSFYQNPASYQDPWAPEPEPNPDLDLLYSPTPNPVAIPHSPAPAHLNNRSPPSVSLSPSRSSLDTLRSIHERGRSIHTTAPQSLKLPALPLSIRGWFGAEDGRDKENVHPLLGDEDKQESAQAEREHIRKKYYSPKNPIVFCHGLLGFDTVTLGPSIASLQVTHWRGIREAFEANGIEVLMTRVPATSTPIDRAKVLLDKISEVYPGRSVHLIGHSMGGLDCRWLTTHLTDRPFRVLSVTTISTPHRGSSFADHFLSTVGPARMPSVLSLLDLLPNGGGDGKAFEFLTVENMRRFNEQTPDVEGVRYFSWGAVYDPGLIDTWKWPHSVVMEKEGPNDGLVSLKSAKWGTYLGTLEGVNHLELIGWVNTARYKWAEIMGREVKFKPVTFYLGIADHLARVVEGQEHAPGDAAGSSGERAETRREGERAAMADSLDKGGSFMSKRGESEERGRRH